MLRMASRNVNGHTVKALREALGYKLGDLAAQLGIKHGTLSNIEAGRRQPSPALARRIADELGVPLTAITYPVPEAVDS